MSEDRRKKTGDADFPNGKSRPKQRSGITGAAQLIGGVKGNLASAGVCLILFVWLADEVFRGGFEKYDLGIRAAVHQLASPSVTQAMQKVTYLGSFNFLLILFFLFFAYC